MALGPGTTVINGQRFDLPERGAYYPIAYGPQSVGVPQISPTMPPFLGAGASAAGGGAAGGYSAVGGYGTADNNSTVASIAAAHPWSWRASPTIWAIAGLIVSLLLLQRIHWRKTILSGQAQAGIGEERAEAGVAA